MKKNDHSNHLQQGLFVPSADWQPPKSFPDLTGVDEIGLDIESRDPKLKESGPGFIRGDAQVVGISIATSDASWYFPIAHLGGGNMDRGNVIRYLRDLLSDPNRLIVGANLQYEFEGLNSLGISIAGPVYDVQIAEALIDEESEAGYSLGALCKKYLGGGKDETLLKLAAEAYSVDAKSGLWKLPAKYVGSYAEYDAQSVLKIKEAQQRIIEEEELQQILAIENKLLPIVFKMRLKGIRIDLEAAAALSKKLKLEEDELRGEMFKEYGCFVDEWSGPMLAKICDRLKIIYPHTARGNVSFTGDFLDASDTKFLMQVSDLRGLSKLRDTFVEGWIFGNEVKGRIHPVWRQMASDEGGTRTGRMAASNPNPQQIPAGKYRKTGEPNEIGRALRACFIPDDGLMWAKFDYSQQEPRILTHFAAECKFTGAVGARQAYINDPKFDVYNYMVQAAGIDRRPAKDCYLGRCYGMGKNKLAAKLGVTVERAVQILAKFDQGIPFVKDIAEDTSHRAQQRGYIRTLLGRRRHFKFWEPTDKFQMERDLKINILPLPLDQAKTRWPGKILQRSNTHKALNALIQGSAADMTKAAMIQNYEQHGILAYMQVHDELNYGVTGEEQATKLQQVIENCVDMTVPIKSDLSLGRHWK